MADYKDIKGGTIQNFAGDPPAPIAGQVWYDNAAAAFQYMSSNPAGSWATSNAMNTARRTLAGAGIQTAALGFGGQVSSTDKVLTESYDGSSWTEVADLNTARASFKCLGTNTSALATGGYTSTQVGVVESWNGSSWTEVGDLNQVRYGMMTAGLNNTSGLVAGGHASSPNSSPNTETWNGTAWTEVGDLNTGRREVPGDGIATVALIFGGNAGTTLQATTEDWNGTSWTEVNNLSTARQLLAGAGTSTAALAFGGGPPDTGATEEWNVPTESTKTVDTD